MEEEEDSRPQLQVSHFLTLPNEIQEYIFSSRCLDVKDLYRIVCTCKRFRTVCDSGDLVWRLKLQQRWPGLISQLKTSQVSCWKREYRQFLEKVRCVHKAVSSLSRKFYKKEEVSNYGLKPFLDCASDNVNSVELVVHELRRILNTGKTECNLTEKYYSNKALSYIRHIQLTTSWQRFLEQPHDKLNLLTGAVLIAEWCQPCVAGMEEDVQVQIEKLAADVRTLLSIRCPAHPVTCVANPAGDSCLSGQSGLTPQQCRHVLEAVNIVLFERQGYSGNVGNYYDERNSYINVVLQQKTGIPITLCVLYWGVAHILGVYLEPVNFPTHFLLRWKEHPRLTGGAEYTYIDAFRQGKFMPQRECGLLLSMHHGVLGDDGYETVANIEVFRRMLRNLVNIGRQQTNAGDSLQCLRNALELSRILSPDDIDLRLLLARLYSHLDINHQEVIDEVNEIMRLQVNVNMIGNMISAAAHRALAEEDRDVPEPISPKLRSENPTVEFAVGMVMQHKRYEYKCVIYGWDSTCKAGEQWIYQMSVHLLKDKDRQPFYNVLVEDGSSRYAAQENLGQAPREELGMITHAEVGRHFSEFTGVCYAPNAEKMEEYPEDFELTKQTLAATLP
ncbi:PREDICTED: F-box only protein 21-like [Priapulus caudatus]|uniref:F-box only protein 21-like n=1 Tax=Priapulus caudatus TaxID=37621 RepID=A0ABM1E289_PRICU|nr:PREDICTED: F-box only protein 21-like [Priapulus caudatus]